MWESTYCGLVGTGQTFPPRIVGESSRAVSLPFYSCGLECTGQPILSPKGIAGVALPETERLTLGWLIVGVGYFCVQPSQQPLSFSFAEQFDHLEVRSTPLRDTRLRRLGAGMYRFCRFFL